MESPLLESSKSPPLVRRWWWIGAVYLFMMALTTQMLWASSATPSLFAQADQPTPATNVALVSAADCNTALSQFWLTASDACVGKPFGFICNGGISPTVEPAGPVSNSLAAVGSLVEINVVDSLRTSLIAPRGENGGMIWLRVSAEESPLEFSGLLVGDVHVRDNTPDGFPAWQNFIVETFEPAEKCETAPFSAFVVQSLPYSSSRVVINGVSLDVNGTTVIQTAANGTINETHFMAISGELSLLTAGQRLTIFAGEETTFTYNPGNYTAPVTNPSLGDAFRPERIDHLPVLLFDFPVFLPQAGVATTQGDVNLRTAPTTDAGVILQATIGERLTVLGRNPEGTWLHVRMADGQTGWMFAELLGGDVKPEDVRNVYVETPVPLQRMGDLGQVAQVIAPNGVTMRTAPDMSFNSMMLIPFGQEVTLLNRSPYSPWVKVDANGQVGWVPLIVLETRAIIDALLVDYDVPPPPEPTRIPGSYGNAFPDTNCFPNC